MPQFARSYKQACSCHHFSMNTRLTEIMHLITNLIRTGTVTEHPIIAVLKSVEAGRTVKDVCREAAISEASYYNWKAKYGGMEAADIKKIKDLEDENRRLKQMFADLSLENRALKDVIEKKL